MFEVSPTNPAFEALADEPTDFVVPFAAFPGAIQEHVLKTVDCAQRIPHLSRARIARAVRTHWHIENCLHYVLDVSLGEDNSRIRRDNSAVNLGTMRNIVMNVLCNKSRDKSSVVRNLKGAAWNMRRPAKIARLSMLLPRKISDLNVF